MPSFLTRARRQPLARTIVLLTGLFALGACSDELAAPKPSRPTPDTRALAIEPIQVTVTNASGGSDVGSLQWAVAQINQPGPTGVIVFDPSLEGATITLDEPLDARRPVEIIGPAKGITLSGNDQHRVINGGTLLSLRNLTLTKGFADLGSAVAAPSLALYNTTVQDNRGAGSAVFANNSLQIINSTVSGNVVGQQAVQYGPLAYVTLDNSTVAYNAPGAGFGPSGYPGSSIQVTLRNSILSNNGNENCSSFFGFAYLGKNISSDWSCGEVGITVADPQLLPLARNGGPNMTHAIPHTSPAYNAGFACTQTTDQRYVARDAKCDVGAFEFNDFTKVTLTIDPNAKVDAKVGGQALLTGTVSCTRDEAIDLVLELRQDQKVNGKPVEVRAQTRTQTACGPTARAWSTKLVLTEGSWQSGAARATASTYSLPEWVSPASVAGAVKISIARK